VSDIRKLLHELADSVADSLETNPEAARYYDQDSSPLPSHTHCKLVRSGALPGFRRHGRVLVERAVMHRYIEEGRVEPAAETEEEKEVAAAIAQIRRTG
jgi:hypothetical protein